MSRKLIDVKYGSSALGAHLKSIPDKELGRAVLNLADLIKSIIKVSSIPYKDAYLCKETLSEINKLLTGCDHVSVRMIKDEF